MTTWAATKDSRIKKRGDVYWARFMKRGQHIQKSLETSSFETAKRAVEALEQDIILGVNWRQEREYFETAWPEFLEDKAKGIKTKLARPKTLREYIGFGERYFKPNLNEIRLCDIEDAWSEMVDKIRIEKPNMHFDNLRKYLMGFSTWAYKKGKIRLKPELYDPDIKRKEDREQESPGLAYTKEQLAKMRDGAKTCGPRFYLFILMAQYMGMRPSEITQLKKDRIDLENEVIRLRKSDTKTKSPREIGIHRNVRGPLTAQVLATEGRSEYLFPNHGDKSRPMDPTGFKKYWGKVKGDEGRVYDFRHTFITHAIEQGLNPAVVARMTGTSLRMIEKRYLHLSIKDVRREIRKFAI